MNAREKIAREHVAKMLALWAREDAPVYAEQERAAVARRAEFDAAQKAQAEWRAANPYPPVQRREGCTCSDDLPLHPCPYESDINENRADVCRCCPVCMEACAEEI